MQDAAQQGRLFPRQVVQTHARGDQAAIQGVLNRNNQSMGKVMSSTFQVRPDESILFQGDVANLQSLPMIKQGHGVVTDQRCVFQWGSETFTAERQDLSDVQEQRHGFRTKLIASLRDGASVTVQAPDMRGLTGAMLALAGRQAVQAAGAQPAKAAVKNGTAWLAALSPFLSGLIVVIAYSAMGWASAEASAFGPLKVLAFRFVLIYLFMKIDHQSLRRQGFAMVSLGIVGPEKFWAYLGSRAKAFGHGKGYVMTWWALLVLDLLFVLLSI
jgi:hypothetical protein